MHSNSKQCSFMDIGNDVKQPRSEPSWRSKGEPLVDPLTATEPVLTLTRLVVPDSTVCKQSIRLSCFALLDDKTRSVHEVVRSDSYTMRSFKLRDRLFNT